MGAQATNSIQKLEYDEATTTTTNNFTTVTIATTAVYTASSSNQWHEQWRVNHNSLATIGHIVHKLNAY